MTHEDRGAFQVENTEQSTLVLNDFETGSLARGFEQICTRFPDRIAIACADRQITYQVFATMLDSFSVLLKARELPPESIIGIIDDRSSQSIAALLATIFCRHGLYYDLPGRSTVLIYPVNTYTRYRLPRNYGRYKPAVPQRAVPRRRVFALS